MTQIAGDEMTEELTDNQVAYARYRAMIAPHEAAQAQHKAEEAAAVRAVMRWVALVVCFIAASAVAGVIHGHHLDIPELEAANAALRAKVVDIEQRNEVLRVALEDYKAGLAGCQARHLWEGTHE